MSTEFLFMYGISVITAGVIGVVIVEWFDKKFEGFIDPLYNKIMKRRKYVLEKRRLDRA